jgi:uracil-DNA glycosylase
MEPAEVLQEVAQQVSVCQKCILHKTRTRSVPGEGPPNAEIMLIGEGPGFNEDMQGRPFVGQAGKLLEELLGKIGTKRGQVFIANVVKCRPPGNRDPMPDELAACGDYLERQVEAINPRVIVTLGRFSMGRYLPNVKISAVHGKPAWVKGRLVVPMYHPAAALHQPAIKPDLERDFMRLPEFIGMARKGERPAPAPAASPAVQAALPIRLAQPPAAEIPAEDKQEPKQLKLF